MSETTSIEWCDHSWSPWIGCTKVSPGCAHCYAATDTFARVSRAHGRELWGRGAQRHRTGASNWKLPLRWDRAAAKAGTRPKVFPSLCDWLDEEVPIGWLAEFLALIHATPRLDWLLLTKRPENWERVLLALAYARSTPEQPQFTDAFRSWLQSWWQEDPLPNVWPGTSVEDQRRAEGRLPALLRIPAKVRFVSAEPLLGPVDFGLAMPPPLPESRNMTLLGPVDFGLAMPVRNKGGPNIDWVIVGGESGPKARPCDVEWVRGIVRQCREAGVKCFVKQLGANPQMGTAWLESGRLVQHPKGGDPSEWPEDLRVREFPHHHNVKVSNHADNPK